MLETARDSAPNLESSDPHQQATLDQITADFVQPHQVYLLSSTLTPQAYSGPYAPLLATLLASTTSIPFQLEEISRSSIGAVPETLLNCH